ncbi:MAG: DUF3426 domain-containing protein [Zoogloeaceae bacterium]|jgi:predicted Zn finger-like uncharacterized protein|nr:DUF3426 domain-containing protein [Zoogloeaceae bacterium]
MLTRCPHCQTVFRALQEQLTAYDGQVRCGACLHPFNARAHFVKEEEDIFLFAWSEDEPQSVPSATPAPQPPQKLDSLTIILADDADPSVLPEDESAAALPMLDPIDELLAMKALSASGEEDGQIAEEIRKQALKGGRIPARLAAWDTHSPDGKTHHYALLPFALAAAFFALFLSVQVILHFRSEISQNSPAFASLFQTLGVETPLAREPESLFIEGSELQTLEAPDRLRLFVTLHNKAHYPLAWPHLEISLTDPYNMMLVRKVFSPEDYLTNEQAQGAFKPGVTLVRLDLGTRAIAPSGYNLYLFYP